MEGERVIAKFTIEKNKNYTVMSSCHLQDRNLSYKAKGLLSFMLSLPKDWDYSTYEVPFDIKPYHQKGNMVKVYTEKESQINTNKENIKEQIDKDDKTKV